MSQKINVTNAVPVTFRHFKFLETCVNDILDQTLLPQEIILIISEYKSDNDSEKKISDLKNLISEKKITPIIKTFNNKQYAGENRQIAYDLCSSDMIVFQDCDDLTHPQRNEILIKTYEKYKIPHLLHGYILKKPEHNKPVLFENISVDIFKSRNPKKFATQGIHNGCPAMVKKVIGDFIFSKFKKQGEDIKTNIYLSRKYKTCLIKIEYLYIYMNENSSWR